MTRQQQLQEISEMTLSEYSLKVIIPCPHKFYENKASIFKTIEKLDWKMLNDSDVRQFGAFNIKAYVYDNIIPNFEENNAQKFIDKEKTIVLQKELNQKCLYSDYNKNGNDLDFTIKAVDLWIFEEHVCFFALDIMLDEYKNYTIDQLAKINNVLRSFKFTTVSKKDEVTILTSSRYKESSDFLKLLLTHTLYLDESFISKIKCQHFFEKSFLNIGVADCMELIIAEKINPIYSIYNSSTNAKLLIGMQTKKTCFSDGIEIEPIDPNNITLQSTKELALISEIPFYIASCTSMNPTKDWTQKDDYIYACADNGGFGVWKYSAGITLHDSAAFIGLAKDGGGVVNNVNNVFYFIYILNLYVYMQTRYIEHQIIDDDFESSSINYWYEKLQKLKNQFITEDIGIKFQENELHTSMLNALKTKDILSEVTDNLVNTKDITQNNKALYITIISFMFVSVFQEPITNFVNEYKIFFFALALPFGIWAYKYRKKIKKLLSKIF